MALSISRNTHLFEGSLVQQIPTSKNTQKFGDSMPDTLVIHYTAGSSAKSSATYLADPAIKASAHLVIGREGEIYQLVPFNVISWHAGISSYMGRVGFNKFSIGIELDNVGALRKSGDEYFSAFGKKIQPNEVVFDRHRNESVKRYWHSYTEKQIQTCEEVCLSIINFFNGHIKHIVGHEEISPGRKTDPGPAFPLDKFREKILGDGRMVDEVEQQSHPQRGVVTIEKLNIRQGASITFNKIALPLNKGTDVTILEEKEGWYKVRTSIEGWVNKGFIKA